ncbi:hypothetical protein [Mesobacillus boroniphilus]|nr:hypothetical protein [Mesobacillus boroniphilus]
MTRRLPGNRLSEGQSPSIPYLETPSQAPLIFEVIPSLSRTWDENAKSIRFDSPYASFAGQLMIYDDAGINVRHLVLSGKFLMKPPSLQAGEAGSWIATTDTVLTGPPINTGALPPVGVFLTSDLLYNTGRRNSGRYSR